jgi:hypothetical protein
MGLRPYIQPPSRKAAFFQAAVSYLQPVFGLQVGAGPPSGAGTIGAATATYVQARPTIRNKTLIARFIVFLLASLLPWEREQNASGF